jgi:inner membrane protein YidH
MKQESKKSESPGELSTRLAYDRTRLAYDRTMMAWIRTGMSLIAFGFTVYKFFQFEASKLVAEAAPRLIDPRRFALIMISIGLAALILSKVEHWRSMKNLRAEGAETPFSMAMIVAWLVSAMGVIALIAVIFRQ